MVGAKVTRLEVGGSEYTLFCSCDAYLQLEEAVGPDVFGGLKELGKLLRAVEILSEAGELLRRDYHYTPGDWYHAPPERGVTPAQRRKLYSAAAEAVLYGLTNEVPQQAEVDLYLLEEQKKRERMDPRPTDPGRGGAGVQRPGRAAPADAGAGDGRHHRQGGQAGSVGASAPEAEPLRGGNGVCPPGGPHFLRRQEMGERRRLKRGSCGPPLKNHPVSRRRLAPCPCRSVAAQGDRRWSGALVRLPPPAAGKPRRSRRGENI